MKTKTYANYIEREDERLNHKHYCIFKSTHGSFFVFINTYHMCGIYQYRLIVKCDHYTF